MEAAKYSAVERLRNGRRVDIRALRPEHRADLIAAVERSSDKSLYQRFFYPKRNFTAKEVAYFVEVDFVNHVALVAVVEEDGRPVIAGGGRYIIVRPGTGELAFAVVDQYQGQGIGAALMRHLVAIAREAGVRELIADVLADNISMQRVLESSGLPLNAMREAGVVHVSLELRVPEAQ
jgi:RimJ/RimL family protein N-acetyltransferase